MTPFKVGLVGCGHIAAAHLKGFQKVDGCEVHGAFDLNRELAEQRAAAFQIEKIYDDLDLLIDECDAVDICTPPHTHADIALKVIEAGKHLLIEKPLVIDVADWERLSEAFAESPTKITVVHNLKFSNGIQQAKGWVDEGRIGRLIRIERFFLTSPKHDRMLVGNTHWSHKLPGGRWFETLPHELYITHYFAGPSDLANVSVIQTPHAPPGAPADEVTITLQNEQCITNIHYSGNCSLNKRSVVFYGTEGIIDVDILGDAITLTRTEDRKWKRLMGLVFLEAGRKMTQMIPDRAAYGMRRLRRETPHTRIIRAFNDHLQGRGPSPTPMDEVDFVVRNCDRVGRAIEAALEAETVA